MHELSIAMSVLEIVEEEAERQGTARVTAVHLRIGPLSGVVKEALVSAFELAREGTPFAECKLMIEEVPITAFCATCQTERTVSSVQHICCPVCDTPMPDITTGRELEVKAMEISE